MITIYLHYIRYNTVIVGMALLCLAVTVSGCFGPSNVHKGRGYKATIPPGWEKGEPVDKPFINISEQEPELATFTSPEERTIYDDPQATISIYTQKFEKPIWVEDIAPQILRWLRQQGYEILGAGKITYQGSIGYSVNYRDWRTGQIYLDFYFATEGKVFLVVTYATTDRYFKKYLQDFEAFRNSIEFTLSLF